MGQHFLGVNISFFREESFYFCELGALAKFQNPMTTPSGRKVTAGEEEDRKKINIKNSRGLPKLLRWSHKPRADRLPKIVAYLSLHRIHFARTNCIID